MDVAPGPLSEKHLQRHDAEELDTFSWQVRATFHILTQPLVVGTSSPQMSEAVSPVFKVPINLIMVGLKYKDQCA